jgi:hypothetical protein
VSWNIDVVLFANSGSLPAADLVLDVLAPRDGLIGLEDATSMMRFDPPELCVSTVGDWGVVIDVPCKLRGLRPFLQERATNRELCLVHVGISPMLLSYRDGAEVRALSGLEDCRSELLRRPH